MAVCSTMQAQTIMVIDWRVGKSRHYTFGPYCSCSKALGNVPSDNLRAGACAGLRW